MISSRWHITSPMRGNKYVNWRTQRAKGLRGSQGPPKQSSTKQSAKLAGGSWDPRRLGDRRFKKLGARTRERDSWHFFWGNNSPRLRGNPPRCSWEKGVSRQDFCTPKLVRVHEGGRSRILQKLWLDLIGRWVAAWLTRVSPINPEDPEPPEQAEGTQATSSLHQQLKWSHVAIGSAFASSEADL